MSPDQESICADEEYNAYLLNRGCVIIKRRLMIADDGCRGNVGLISRLLFLTRKNLRCEIADINTCYSSCVFMCLGILCGKCKRLLWLAGRVWFAGLYLFV